MNRSYATLLIQPLVLALFICIALITTGCSESDDSDSDVSTADSPANTRLVKEHDTVRLIAAPIVTFTFELPAGATAMHLVATAPGYRLRLSALSAPNGKPIYLADSSGDSKFSAAGDYQSSPNAFNYPFGQQSVILNKGEYRAVYEIEAKNGVPVSEVELEDVALRVFTKSDTDSQRGTVNVTLFYGDVITNSKELRDNMDYVVGLAQDHLNRAGISTYITRVNLPELPELLPNPVTGDLLYREMARESGWGINIYFATDASGTGTQRNESVLSGASPAALVPGNRSAIVVSVSKAAGSDGRFDGEDRQPGDDSEFDILADNLSHEIFHYLGLSDSVTFQGSNVVATDGLDSEKCSTVNNCQDNRGANENVMFPYALEKDNVQGNQYFPRYRVSDQQILFANRYIAVD